MKRIYFLLTIALIILSGCRVRPLPESSVESFNAENYLEALERVESENDLPYRIVEKEIFDLSTEGGHLIAIYYHEVLRYIQFTSANSINTNKYEFTLFDECLIVSITKVQFVPADTTKEFSTENMEILNIKQDTYLLSGENISNLSNGEVNISTKLSNQEKEDLLNLFIQLTSDLN